MRSRCRGQSTMLKTTITDFRAAAAAAKKSRTAASLYFCWVSTAIRTSQALRTSSARCQFSRSVPSTSGVSRRMSRGGCRPPGSSRHTSRSSPSAPPPSESSVPVHSWGVKPGNRLAMSMRPAMPRGRLATGQRVRAASGTDWVIGLPTSTLVSRLLPVLVPPHTAATSTASRVTCGRNFPNSCPYHSVPVGSGTPRAAPSGRSASISPHNSPTFAAHA